MVNVHHTVEFVDAQIVGWVRRLQDAGARDEDVDGPDVLLDGIGRCVDGRVGLDIQLDCVAPQTFRDLARRLYVDVRNDDPGTVDRELPGARFTDAAGAACDDGQAVLKF